MSAAHDRRLPPADDVIDLEPTMDSELAGLRAAMATGSQQAVTAAVPDESNIASIVDETRTLRRHRLAATALLLAVAYAVLLAWHLAYMPSHGPIGWALIASRFVLADDRRRPAPEPDPACPPPRSGSWNSLLFGGMTIIVFVSQYVVNLSMLERGDTIGMVAFMKNGVIQMVVLMLLYGTFIPNPPRTVAWAVLLMALAPLAQHRPPDRASPRPPISRRSSGPAEYTGSNALFLLMGAGMAICGSILLNGLRTELHQARKFGQYQLVRKLGEGGMGVVYLAEHRLLKRPCA